MADRNSHVISAAQLLDHLPGSSPTTDPANGGSALATLRLSRRCPRQSFRDSGKVESLWGSDAALW